MVRRSFTHSGKLARASSFKANQLYQQIGQATASWVSRRVGNYARAPLRLTARVGQGGMATITR